MSGGGATGADRGGGTGLLPVNLVRLARPHQWAKSVFVLVGPFYGLADMDASWTSVAVAALIAAAAFAMASSGCYVINDIVDAEQDRAHPRKARRPIASGAVSPAVGAVFGAALLAGGFAATLALPGRGASGWLALTLGIYVANVLTYSFFFKHLVIADVMFLAMGFVLRVFGGCAAVGIVPSVWLLNCTFFLAMFLAFGKRLGERRTLREGAAEARLVQSVYTDDLLRMAVVVTGVATLVGYTVYVAEQEAYTRGFNLLWLTILPATYVLLRCVVLLERGLYDDPTELAVNDRGFQAGALLFGLMTAALIWHFRLGGAGALS